MPGPAPSDAPVPSDSPYVFVYGILMRGFDLHHHMGDAAFVGPAAVSGTLYSLGTYPGMVDGAGTVRGELYRSRDIAVTLEVLDEVEGYDPLDVEAGEYVRVLRDVRLDAGGKQPAWLYLYNRDIKGRQQIKSGDWRKP